MSFLNPVILYGLAAAAVPLLIHLLTRSKRRIIPFSTLRFLKELENRQRRRLRLRQMLLLILRTLVILLLVLAFARPTLRRGPATPGLSETASAVILDDSFSMNRRGADGDVLFDEAKRRALRLLSTLQPNDRVVLLSPVDTAAVDRPFLDPLAAAEAIHRAEIRYGRTDLSGAVAAALRRLAASSAAHKEIYHFSDLQRTGFRTDMPPAEAPNVPVYAAALPPAENVNLAVQELALKTTILQRGKTALLETTVHNSGSRPVSGAVLRLFVNDTPTAQEAVDAAPGGTVTVQLRFMLERPGFTVARVILEDDDLLEDNRRELAFRVPDSLRIGLFSRNSAGTFYLQAALQSDENGTGFFRLRHLSAADLRRLPELDAVILDEPADIDDSAAESLRLFVRRGGGLLLVLGPAVDTALNDILLPRLELPPISESLTSAGAGDFTLGAVDLTHPLFSGIFESERSDLVRPRFRFAFRVPPAAGIDPILRFSSGDPYLLEKKLGDGRILVLTAPFDPRLSDIVRQTLFAPLMTGIMFRAASAAEAVSPPAMIGEELHYVVPPSQAGSTFVMRRPDEQEDRLVARLTPEGAALHYAQTDLPGIYRLYADRRLLQHWAVHLPAEESLLTPIESAALQDLCGARLVPPNQDLAEFASAQRRGIELRKGFLGAALLLLVAEMILYREKGEVLPQPDGG